MVGALLEGEALSPYCRIPRRPARILCTLVVAAAPLACWHSGGWNAIRGRVAKLSDVSRRLQLNFPFVFPLFGGDASFKDCMDLKDTILELNGTEWPQVHEQESPKISRIVYLNLNQDEARSAFAKQELGSLVSPAGSLFDVWRWNTLPSIKAKADDWYEPFRRTGFARDDFELQGMEDSEFLESKLTEELEISDVERRKWAVASITFTHWLVLNNMAHGAADMIMNNEVWLIMDDDATVPPELYTFWQQLWPFVPEDWDVLHLGAAEDAPPEGCKSQVNGHLEFAVRKWNMEEIPCKACKKALAYIVNPKSVGQVLWRFMHAKINHVHNMLSAMTPMGEDPDICPPLKAFNVHPTLIESTEFKLKQPEPSPTTTTEADTLRINRRHHSHIEHDDDEDDERDDERDDEDVVEVDDAENHGTKKHHHALLDEDEDIG